MLRRIQRVFNRGRKELIKGDFEWPSNGLSRDNQADDIAVITSHLVQLLCCHGEAARQYKLQGPPTAFEVDVRLLEPKGYQVYYEFKW